MWTIVKPSSNPETQKRLEWVRDMLNASEKTANAIGVTPEAIVAQAAQETGWGASRQGRYGMFGVKAGPGWTGLTVDCPTWEVIDGQTVNIVARFRDYPTLQDAVEDHFRFLKENSRYAQAGVFDRQGDEHYFYALQKAGYATDPKYAKNLIAVRDTLINYYLPMLSPDGREPPPAPPRVLNIGDYGPDVKLLQDALTRQGYDTGGIDGHFGRMTYRAVLAFQTAKNLSIDGVVGDQTRKALGI